MMDKSKVLAKIIGPLLIIPALGILLNREIYQRMFEEFAKSPSLCYLGGFMALLCGLLVVHFHNVWEARWPVIITILGWLCVVKGAALVLFPGTVAQLWHPFTGSTVPLMVSSSISCALGVYLTVKGYSG
jgi:hypothetical protein